MELSLSHLRAASRHSVNKGIKHLVFLEECLFFKLYISILKLLYGV